MSHQPERKEKNCLNCGTTVAGRFCQACGQENIVPKQTVLGFIRHFVYDIFHFDGKFFATLKYLVLRPGFVAREYMHGRRQSYLDPMRMYLFTSALFFLVFFAVKDPKEGIRMDNAPIVNKEDRYNLTLAALDRRQHYPNDTLVQRQLHFLLDTSYRLFLFDPKAKLSRDSSVPIRLNNRDYLMKPVKAGRENFEINAGSNWVNNRWKRYKHKFNGDDRAMVTELVLTFFHRIPYLLFVSLPFFALVLKLLYVRRKEFFYSDHATFTLYHYIFTFILFLLYLLAGALFDWTGWGFFRLLSILLVLVPGAYLLFAMKGFYAQGWGKTIVKFLALNFLGLLIMILLMMVFLVLSFL